MFQIHVNYQLENCGCNKRNRDIDIDIILKKILEMDMIYDKISRFLILFGKKLFKIKICKCPVSNKNLSHFHFLSIFRKFVFLTADCLASKKFKLNPRFFVHTGIVDGTNDLYNLSIYNHLRNVSKKTSVPR
jgi:hypothetical protein